MRKAAFGRGARGQRAWFVARRAMNLLPETAKPCDNGISLRKSGVNAGAKAAQMRGRGLAPVGKHVEQRGGLGSRDGNGVRGQTARSKCELIEEIARAD